MFPPTFFPSFNTLYFLSHTTAAFLHLSLLHPFFLSLLLFPFLPSSLLYSSSLPSRTAPLGYERPARKSQIRESLVPFCLIWNRRLPPTPALSLLVFQRLTLSHLSLPPTPGFVSLCITTPFTLSLSFSLSLSLLSAF